MVTKTKLIKEFKCPNCGRSETIVGLALKEVIERGLCKEDTPYSMIKQIIPLIPPASAPLLVPSIIIHQDVCAHCGTLYCTKAETMDSPREVFMPAMMPKSPLPPGFGKR